MQLHAAQHPTAETSKKGRQTSKVTVAGTERHAISVRMSREGFSLHLESGNSWLIFAIVVVLAMSFVGVVALVKLV